MTPKQKAKELIIKFMTVPFAEFDTTSVNHGKGCALIAAEEARKESVMNDSEKREQYWYYVIQEIENI